MWQQEPPEFTAKDGDLMEYTLKLAKKLYIKEREILHIQCVRSLYYRDFQHHLIRRH